MCVIQHRFEPDNIEFWRFWVSTSYCALQYITAWFISRVMFYSKDWDMQNQSPWNDRQQTALQVFEAIRLCPKGIPVSLICHCGTESFSVLNKTTSNRCSDKRPQIFFLLLLLAVCPYSSLDTFIYLLGAVSRKPKGQSISMLYYSIVASKHLCCIHLLC